MWPRHCLLAVITALVAARPLVPADPESAAGAWLTFGWLVALAAWAVWHAWAKPGVRIGGLVAAGLAATAALVVIRTATGVPYQWLGWRVAWEWVGLVAA